MDLLHNLNLSDELSRNEFERKLGSRASEVVMSLRDKRSFEEEIGNGGRCNGYEEEDGCGFDGKAEECE